MKNTCEDILNERQIADIMYRRSDLDEWLDEKRTVEGEE